MKIKKFDLSFLIPTIDNFSIVSYVLLFAWIFLLAPLSLFFFSNNEVIEGSNQLRVLSYLSSMSIVLFLSLYSLLSKRKFFNKKIFLSSLGFVLIIISNPNIFIVNNGSSLIFTLIYFLAINTLEIEDIVQSILFLLPILIIFLVFQGLIIGYPTYPASTKSIIIRRTS